MKTAFVFLADGFEEIEALTPVDYLRRSGVDARTVSITGSRDVVGARKIAVKAALLFEDMPGADDCLILPGGMPGSRNLASHAGLYSLLKKAMNSRIVVGAICAAPALVLGKAGLLAGRRFTCFPGMEKEAGTGAVHLQDRVVTDGNLVTSRAAGTAGECAGALGEALAGRDAARELAESVLLSGAP